MAFRIISDTKELISCYLCFVSLLVKFDLFVAFCWLELANFTRVYDANTTTLETMRFIFVWWWQLTFRHKLHLHSHYSCKATLIVGLFWTFRCNHPQILPFRFGLLLLFQGFSHEEECTSKVLRWRCDSEEEVVRKAEGRKETNEARWLCWHTTGGFSWTVEGFLDGPCQRLAVFVTTNNRSFCPFSIPSTVVLPFLLFITRMCLRWPSSFEDLFGEKLLFRIEKKE